MRTLGLGRPSDIPSFDRHTHPDTDPLAPGLDADFLAVFQEFVDEMNHSVRKIRTLHNINLRFRTLFAALTRETTLSFFGMCTAPI
jgi:hypothetical protein